MDCTDPTQVTAEDLLGYATGEGDGHTAAHVAACASCAAEADFYGTADRTLRLALFRADCPDSQVLGELALGLLDPEDTLPVRAHLALCHHCREELAALTDALRGDPMEDLIPAPGRIRRILARLVPPPEPAPAYVTVRGAGGSETSTYEAEGLSISLSVRWDDRQRPPSWALLGLVADAAGESPPAGTAAHLRQGDRIVADATLDEWGHVTFSGLESGTYELEVELSDRVIAVENIEVGPEAS